MKKKESTYHNNKFLSYKKKDVYSAHFKKPQKNIKEENFSYHELQKKKTHENYNTTRRKYSSLFIHIPYLRNTYIKFTTTSFRE